MRTIARIFMGLFLSLVSVSGLNVTLGWGLPADNSESSESYYPPPESAGGWRRCKNDEEVRRLASMNPEKLDKVGQTIIALYPGPWQLLVIRHGYIVREWMGVPAMPQTAFDVWSCTKSATGIAYGLLLDDSRNHQLPKDAQIDLESPAYSFIPKGYPLSDPGKEKIKLRHLLSMTSGIPGEDHGIIGIEVTPGGGEFEFGLGKQPDRFGNSAARLYAQPGEAWDYSDAGFVHLALIFSHLMGKEISDVMKARVFQPIGIENSGWDLQGARGISAPTPMPTAACASPPATSRAWVICCRVEGHGRTNRLCPSGGLTSRPVAPRT